VRKTIVFLFLLWIPIYSKGESLMDKDKKILMMKAMLVISGIAFLFLITSAGKSALCGCFVAIVFWCIFLWKVSAAFETLKSLVKPVYVVLGVLFCGAAGSNFYDTWVVSGKIQRISDLFHVGKEKFGLVCTTVGVVAAIPVVSMCLSFFITTVLTDFGNVVQENSVMKNSAKRIPIKKAFLILAGIYTLGISAILRANFNYIDDMGRVAGGYRNWKNFSRFLSEALSPFIHMDSYLTDVSPLPQLIAVLLLTFSGIILLYIVYERNCFSIWELIALVPLGLNPYFLECISYKYDSPYMALSVLGGILPFLYRKKSAITYIGASVIGTVAVCTSYQAAAGIYPMITIVLMLQMWSNKDTFRKTVGFCLRSVTGYGLGIAFFKVIIMVPVETYVSNSLIGIRELVPGIFNNLKKYYTLVKSDFKTFWLVLVVVLAIGFVWTEVYLSGQNKYLSVVVSTVSLLFMGLLCFGMYPALSAPLFSPRAMYGFGIFIAILEVNIVGRQGKFIFRISALAVSWMFFVFTFTYGNALYTQKEYTDFRIQTVMEDFNDIDVFHSGQTVTVQISGTIGQSPILKNMPQDYQILNRLVPITFREKWWWGQCGFYQYYALKNVIADSSVDLTTYELPVLEDKMYHTIKGKDNYILVELK